MNLKSFLPFLALLLSDQRGESFDPNDGDDGQAGGPDEDGQSAGPGEGQDGQGGLGQSAQGAQDAGDDQSQEGDGQEGQSQEGQDGQADDKSIDPQAYQKLVKEHSFIKSRFDQTARNLATMRKALETQGIRIDRNGNVIKAEAPKTRFNDKHKELFEQPHLEAIQALVEDMLDGRFSKFEEQGRQKSEFSQAYEQSTQNMFTMFPQLKHDSKEFDKTFHDMTVQRYQEAYDGNPYGELLAAIDVARNLNIPSRAINKAKKEAFANGQANRKVIGNVPSNQGQKAKAFRNLPFEEYQKLSDEDKQKYDRQEAEQRFSAVNGGKR